MAHVRKTIRRILDEMGFDNQFQVCEQGMRGYHEGEPLTVIINDWEPNGSAIELKKRIQYCTDEGCIDVIFQVNESCPEIARRSMPAKKLPSRTMA